MHRWVGVKVAPERHAVQSEHLENVSSWTERGKNAGGTGVIGQPDRGPELGGDPAGDEVGDCEHVDGVRAVRSSGGKGVMPKFQMHQRW